MLQSFYVPVAEGVFESTALTRGPWSMGHQHGGPPAALLARAIEEELAQGPAMQVARLTLDLPRPVPIARVTVSVTAERTGKKVRVVTATLEADGAVVMRARAVAIRRAEVVLPPLRPGHGAPSAPPALTPEEAAPFAFPFFPSEVSYASGMETRRTAGNFGEGALALWMRMKAPLVPGEAPSPLQRVAIAADSGNGISVAADIEKYTFLNPDLDVTLFRPLEGEWVHLDAATVLTASGVGLARTSLSDVRGTLGFGTQTLVVETR